ncbi:SdpI family protein [Dokdonia sinensis]|uniref:SdpI family protein n=1 Tax=Dokdonia sinensis TaxID=2479847 RepID=A0A3M0GGB2_9FLAO|nr:SdpI family protein [Dokdonia sinensis]RMB63328.1 SdpI family protein [Dokdonia sinensis]
MLAGTDLEIDLVILFDCFLFIGLAWYYLKRPPKEINGLYGFRTRRTMANQDIWDEANKRNAQDLFKWSLVLLGVQIIAWLLGIPHRIIIHLVVMLVGLGFAIFATINYLDKHFDKNGNRK